MTRSAARVAFGDWQTPPALARQVVRALAREGVAPTVVVEPTCGVGAFLAAAREQWPAAALRGFDVNPGYVAAAGRVDGAVVEVADFFATDWDRALAGDGAVLVLGNPPWVTSAELGALGASNLPRKANFKRLRGLDALTGKSNFDVSEWMLLRLIGASPPGATIAMLCKVAVARRVLEVCAAEGLPVAGELRAIDAAGHFGASVDAALLVVRVGVEASYEWPVFADLDASEASASVGVVDGVLTGDADAFRRTAGLGGSSSPEWRSGLKHDCAAVMELRVGAEGLVNGLGERVDVEDGVVFPLLKGSDVANGRLAPQRAVLVPQRRLGEDTAGLAATAPKAWAYLSRHRERLEARKSSIYRDQPAFAVFGVGEYAFAPWKVAICGLYKRLAFRVVGPAGGKPVILDDTCTFLPFGSEREAREAHARLSSPAATAFLEARVFWDAKRPVGKAVLQSLDLAKVAP